MRNCGFDATIGSTASQTSFQLPMRPTSSDNGHLAHPLPERAEQVDVVLVKPEADTRDAESYRQQYENFCQPFRQQNVTSP